MKMVINYLTENDFEIISTVEAVEDKQLTPSAKPIIQRQTVVKSTASPTLLTWQQMQQYPVLQKTQLASGKIIYRPRSEKGKNMIYKVDSILAGLSEKQVNHRKCIIVDKDDFIISNSFA